MAPTARSRASAGALTRSIASSLRCLEMTRVQARARREAELQLPHALIRALQIARLLPRGRHQRFLMLLHDARAERRDAAMTRIEIQLIEPRRAPRA